MLMISDFMRDFHKKLYEVAPEEVKREITKQERAVRHALYMVVGQFQEFRKEDAIKYQERFHVRIDQMASDYHTWKRGGCKTYAKPKQYISGRVAGASKKAFDQVLNTYLLQTRSLAPKVEPNKLVLQEEEPMADCA